MERRSSLLDEEARHEHGWTMLVRVRLRGWLEAALPGGQDTLDVPVGTTTSGVLDLLGVPAGPCIFILNGQQATYDAELRQGDRIEIAHMASGG
jgi:sulfur carrier protein ThiS